MSSFIYTTIQWNRTLISFPLRIKSVKELSNIVVGCTLALVSSLLGCAPSSSPPDPLADLENQVKPGKGDDPHGGTTTILGTAFVFTGSPDIATYPKATGANVCAIEDRSDGEVVVRTDIACATVDADGHYELTVPESAEVLVAISMDALPGSAGTMWPLFSGTAPTQSIFYVYPAQFVALATNPTNPGAGPDVTKGALTFAGLRFDATKYPPRDSWYDEPFSMLADLQVELDTGEPAVYFDDQLQPDFAAHRTSSQGRAVFGGLQPGPRLLRVWAPVTGPGSFAPEDCNIFFGSSIVRSSGGGLAYYTPIFKGVLTASGLSCKSPSSSGR
jgi:hypothetical protein